MEGDWALKVKWHGRGWAVNWHWSGGGSVCWSSASTSENLPSSALLWSNGAEPRCGKSASLEYWCNGAAVVDWAQGGPVVHLGVGAAVVDWSECGAMVCWGKRTVVVYWCKCGCVVVYWCKGGAVVWDRCGVVYTSWCISAAAVMGAWA